VKPIQTPVRIYVLWHPSCEGGESLARHIYHWFRLPTAEGIPVYFRSSEDPAGPGFQDISERSCDHNIIVPLVDPHMVASLPWRRMVEDLAGKPSQPDGGVAGHHLLPIALHNTAYQMPTAVRNLNFIRHTDQARSGADESLLTKLTEALCLLLRGLVARGATNPIKIFLSHAKADGTSIPRDIKNFIQTETQCHTFFDENDIAYGHDFSKVISDALEEESAGLLVVQGDHYADRPWCRKEIRDFLMPVEIVDREVPTPHLFSVMPAVVVAGFDGRKVARTIPELGHASCIQWKAGAARSAVVTLLREILFSNFYRLLAMKVKLDPASRKSGARLLVNRPPDPVMIEHLCRIAEVDKRAEEGVTVHHPGHGLSGVELKGLKSIYPNLRFHAFGSTPEPRTGDSDATGPGKFAGKVLAISAGNSCDILDAGLSDEHTVELLTNILHPLFKGDISLLYGGSLPTWKQAEPPWAKPVNFTQTFLDLLLAERDKAPEEPEPGQTPKQRKHPAPSRLFNLSAWTHSLNFTINDEAQWINTCSFIKIDQAKAGIPEQDILEHPHKSGDQVYATQLNAARCLTKMRHMACRKIDCDIPDDPEFSFTPIAHLFIGGKLSGYSGIVPGIWEEILHAIEAKQPCFVVGVTRGAAGKVAGWLLKRPKRKPLELTLDYHVQRAKYGDYFDRFNTDLEEFPEPLTPETALERLWNIIKGGNKAKNLDKILRNGLSHANNRKLLKLTDFRQISDLIGQGMQKLNARKR